MARLGNFALVLAALFAPAGCFSTCWCGPGGVDPPTDAGKDAGRPDCGSAVEWSAANPDVEQVLPRSVVVLPSGDVVVGSAYGEPKTVFGDHASYQLQRLDGATGALMWSRVIPGPIRIHSLTLGVAPSGELVLVAGAQTETDLGSGTMFTASVYLAVYDPASGVLLRALPLPTSGWLRVYDLALDDAGFAYVVGDFTMVLDLPGLAATPAYDGFDTFIARVNLEDGSPVWARGYGGERDDRAFSVVADADGGAALTSVFYGPVEIGGRTLQAIEPEQSSFVARFTVDGDVSWVTQIDGKVAFYIDMDAAGDCYAIGYLRTDVLFVDGSPEFVAGQEGGLAVLTKLASDGTHRWSRRLATGAEVRATGLRVDPNGVTTLLFTGTGLAFEAGPALAEGVAGFALARVSTDGDVTWTYGLPTGMSGVTEPETVIGALAVDRCTMTAAVLYGSNDGLPELPPPVAGPDTDSDAVVFRVLLPP